MSTQLFERALNEAVKGPRYKAPDDPYLKFKSDLARELTAKHFPFLYGSKQDKKVYRTPGYYFNHRESCPAFETGGGSDQLWLSPRGHGTGIIGVISSDGKGEEYFVNTNSYFPDEGYSTDQNFYYQGPTWTLEYYDEGHAPGEDGNKPFKSGLKRNELAEAIIELYKTYQSSLNYDEKWNDWMEEVQDTINEDKENITKYTGYLDGSIDPGYPIEDWQRKRYQTFINGWTKDIKEYEEYLSAPALPPDLNNSDVTAEPKARSWFYGTVDENPDPDGPNGHYASWTYWVAPGFNKAEAVKRVKHSWQCSRRASTGSSQKPHWLAASVRCNGEIDKDIKEWYDEMDKKYPGRVYIIKD